MRRKQSSMLMILPLVGMVLQTPCYGAPYPEPLQGAWGGRAEYAGDDRPAVAEKACRSYKSDPQSVEGDVLVFEQDKKQSLGGYADYTDQNLSIEQVGPGRWRIRDRHFQDEEGRQKPGYRTDEYEAAIEANTLTIKRGRKTSRFERCAFSQAQQATKPQTPVRSVLQLKLGQCVGTEIEKITDRFDQPLRNSTSTGGTAVIYRNGLRQVSYEFETAIGRSRPGDPVRICLVSLPASCPPGDDRGKVYRTMNLRTGEAWVLSDSQHSCGGA